MDTHWRPQVYFCGFLTPTFHKPFRVLRFEQTQHIVNYLHSFVSPVYLNDGSGGKANVSLKQFMLLPRKRTGNTDDKSIECFSGVEYHDEDDNDENATQDNRDNAVVQFMPPTQGAVQQWLQHLLGHFIIYGSSSFTQDGH